MVETSRRPRRSSHCASNEEVHLLVLVFCLFPSVGSYLFSISCVVDLLLRLSDRLILVLLVLSFIFDLVNCNNIY